MAKEREDLLFLNMFSALTAPEGRFFPVVYNLDFLFYSVFAVSQVGQRLLTAPSSGCQLVLMRLMRLASTDAAEKPRGT